MKTSPWICAMSLLTVTLGAGCHTRPASAVVTTTPPPASANATVAAVAELNPTQGSNARGKVSFSQVGNGIRVVADVSGLTPGNHGFHIHEKGDCSAPDGSSAGGHFNPYGMPHAAMDADQRHVGDFGNIVADRSGNAHADFIDVRISFSGLANIVGRGVIIHANPDDLVSQPAGNAGPRAACGVIQAAGK
ncbi:MAG TPA: superoxide dismutase family protein [Candidatus Saccharimonadales bacterium]|nr:superoxide dismutase family protein [Candidatus Saccharimonadales bacterium]